MTTDTYVCEGCLRRFSHAPQTLLSDGIAFCSEACYIARSAELRLKEFGVEIRKPEPQPQPS